MLQAERLADLAPGTLSPLRRKWRRQRPGKRMMDSCRQRTGAGLRESLVRDWSVVSLPNGHSPRRISTLPALPATDLRISASTRGPRVQCHLLSLSQNLVGRLGKDSPRSMRWHSAASAVNFHSRPHCAVDHSGGHPPARAHMPRREHNVARFGARGKLFGPNQSLGTVFTNDGLSLLKRETSSLEREMLRRPATRMELKAEDVEEYEQVYAPLPAAAIRTPACVF